VPSAASLAVALRQRAPEPGQVDRLLGERRLVRTWAMRGTLHLLDVRDAPAYLALLAAARTWEKGAWQKAFLDAGRLERLTDAVVRLLDVPVLTRAAHPGRRRAHRRPRARRAAAQRVERRAQAAVLAGPALPGPARRPAGNVHQPAHVGGRLARPAAARRGGRGRGRGVPGRARAGEPGGVRPVAAARRDPQGRPARLVRGPRAGGRRGRAAVRPARGRRRPRRDGAVGRRAPAARVRPVPARPRDGGPARPRAVPPRRGQPRGRLDRARRRHRGRVAGTWSAEADRIDVRFAESGDVPGTRSSARPTAWRRRRPARPDG
jgi:hypothetical protein